MKRQRLDCLLLERGLVESREKARRLIMAGEVSVDERVPIKPSTMVSGEEHIVVKSKPPFVSRAGSKLSAALDRFDVSVKELVAVDIGASTGGFTDCLLQRGAARVYAVDVGYGQLAWALRQDPRVVVMEKVNARYLESLPEPIDIATFDVSFISLRLVIPPALRLLKTGTSLVALIKPQFEAGRRQIGKGGVVTDHDVHRDVLRKLIQWARDEGLSFLGLVTSPLLGPAGNAEFLIHLGYGVPDPGLISEDWVQLCLSQIPNS